MGIYIDGKLVQKSLETSIKSLALQRFTKIKENLLLGISVNTIFFHSLYQLLNKYLEYAEKFKSKNTLRREKAIIKKLKNFFGDISLQHINQQKLEEYLQSQKISPASLNREIAFLKFLFKKAVEWNYLAYNPAEKLQKQKVQQKPIKYLTNEEIKTILKNSNEEFKKIILFLLYTGLRLSEFVNLKWSDIDFNKKIITIQKTKSYKVRYIPLSDVVEKILLSWKSREKPCRYSGDYISHYLIKLGKKLNIKLSPHLLRHTFASRLVMQGVSLRVVQELLGHSDIKTTMVYSHLAPDYYKIKLKIL